MKQLKRILMVLMCAGVLVSVTACGKDENADDNGAVNGGTTDNAGNSGSDGTGTTTGNGTNDATNGNTGNGSTGNTANDNGEGVMDEIGDDIKDGAEDVGDALDGNDNNSQDKETNDR